MQRLLLAMRAASEPTRLRILALCRYGELTVSELVDILGQSQPRVSRHLKLLVEAGLLERNREASWSFYRLSKDDPMTALIDTLLALIPVDDPVATLDRERLAAVKQERTRRADEYFRRNAANWSRIRALHTDEAKVDRAVRDVLLRSQPETLLDIGTGTGHVLALAAPDVKSAIGIDASHEMLSVARDRMERAQLSNCQVRHADMYHLPFESGRFDAVTIHMVLHYADRPASVIREAGRVLRPDGRLILIDFAPHEVAAMREEHAHLWMGFSDDELKGHFLDAGLEPEKPVHLAGDPLTVSIWSARRAATSLAVADERTVAA